VLGGGVWEGVWVLCGVWGGVCGGWVCGVWGCGCVCVCVCVSEIHQHYLDGVWDTENAIMMKEISSCCSSE